MHSLHNNRHEKGQQSAVYRQTNNIFKIFKVFIKVCAKFWTYHKKGLNNGKMTPPCLIQDMDKGLFSHNSTAFRFSQLIHSYSKQMFAMECNYFR